MEEALYGDGGYYSATPLPIGPGPECDFATAPSLSSLFGECTARLLARLDELLGARATIFEAGPGNAEHLTAVLSRGARPALAWDRIRRPLPAEARWIEDLDAVLPGSVNGLVFSCELFDASPFHRLIGLPDGEVGELWVGLDSAGEFTWQRGGLSDPSLVQLLGDESLQIGQVADLAADWEPAYRRLASRLGAGAMITCDYGFERRALLDARVRRHGTLACYRRHRVHRNPFVDVGAQDLTAWVDFTALREAGEAEGLTTVAFLRLAEWLGHLGILNGLQEADVETRSEALALLDPEGIGHDLRVLVQTRGRAVSAALAALLFP